jgi:hypothetical protein
MFSASSGIIISIYELLNAGLCGANVYRDIPLRRCTFLLYKEVIYVNFVYIEDFNIQPLRFECIARFRKLVSLDHRVRASVESRMV